MDRPVNKSMNLRERGLSRRLSETQFEYNIENRGRRNPLQFELS